MCKVAQCVVEIWEVMDTHNAHLPYLDSQRRLWVLSALQALSLRADLWHDGGPTELASGSKMTKYEIGFTVRLREQQQLLLLLLLRGKQLLLWWRISPQGLTMTHTHTHTHSSTECWQVSRLPGVGGGRVREKRKRRWSGGGDAETECNWWPLIHIALSYL